MIYMLNQIILVGRIAQDPEAKDTESGKVVSNLRLAIQRNYKNENGEYDTDFFNVTLWNGLAQNVSEYCKVGDIVGVKGRIQNNVYEKDNEEKEYKITIVAEKVSFLSTRANREQQQER